MSNQSMEGEDLRIINNEKEEEYNRFEEKPSVWKGYFSWRHPRVLLTSLIFVLFVYQGLGLIFTELMDVIYFFRSVPGTGGSLFFITIFGSFFILLLTSPIVICFFSIDGLYQINTRNYTAGKKFLYSICIILLVFFGTPFIRLFTLWVISLFL